MAELLKVPRIQRRMFAVQRGQTFARQEEDGSEVTLFPLTFSSEEPVLRWSWDGRYYEVLSHEPADVDLSVAEEGLPYLKSHDRHQHCGSVEDIVLQPKEKRLGGNARFSSIALGQEQETMVREGHTKRVSVGYEILGFQLVSKDAKTNIPTYRVSWRPLEVSGEPIPADQTVGFGRSQANRPWGERDGIKDVEMVEFTVEERAAEPLAEGEREMAQELKPGAVPETPASAVRSMEPAPQPPREEKRNDAADIVELAESHGMGAQAVQWLRENRTIDQVRSMILDKIRTKGSSQPPAEAIDLLSTKDRGRYSIARALRMQLEMINGKRKGYDGLEAEVHEELRKNRSGGATDQGGILVPWRLAPDESEHMRSAVRALGTTESAGGATLVGEVKMPEMIDILKNATLCVVAGARMLTGLSGVVVWNKKTGLPTVYWMGENPSAGATTSQPSYGEVKLSPKTLIGHVEIPRQLLVQAGIDVEADVRKDLGEGHGLALDLGGLHGIGADKQPLGLWNTPDVLTETIDGVPSFGSLVNMAAAVADQNADMGSQSYMTTPLMAGVLKQTPVVDGNPLMIWDGKFREGEAAGYPARATNQISKTLGAGADEHGIVFGNWRDMVFGLWGNELELVIDPYTAASSAQVKITSFSMGDAAILRPESFCIGTGAVLSV